MKTRSGGNVDVMFFVLINPSNNTRCQVAKCSDQQQPTSDLIQPTLESVVDDYKKSDQICYSTNINTVLKVQDIGTSLVNETVKCHCYLHGKTPNHTGHVIISEVQEKDGGLWCVELSNSKGSGSFHFMLNVLNGTHNIIREHNFFFLK